MKLEGGSELAVQHAIIVFGQNDTMAHSHQSKLQWNTEPWIFSYCQATIDT